MLLASHNSWSYLKPKKWWMKLLGFTAKCQDDNLKIQYLVYGVRCFDLRVNFKDDKLQVNHGLIVYDITEEQLSDDLEWLNGKPDVAVRVLLDIRGRKDCTEEQTALFRIFCRRLVREYYNIRFWCGRCTGNWNIIYMFDYSPTCEEKYASVCKPGILDDWFPRWFALRNTRRLYEEGSDSDYLMLDFVNYIKR